MAVSEERLQILLSREMKKGLRESARRKGVSVAEYIRRLIEEDREGRGEVPAAFPFGERPIQTGRTLGSVDHDRPEE